METLSAIGELGLLSQEEVTHLVEAYRFLRRLENLLQAMGDKQTQTLPDNEDDQLRLAIAMGFASYDELVGETQLHMSQVHQVFEHLIGDDEEEGESVPRHFHELWDMANNQEVLENVLEQDIHTNDPCRVASTIRQFKADLAKKTLGPRGREVLNRLMPKAFNAIYAHPEAEFGLPRGFAPFA